MRILFLSQLLPCPNNAGPKVRIYHVLQYLAMVGHEITLVTFSRESDKPKDIADLNHICRHIYTIPMPRSKLRDAKHLLESLVTNEPFLIRRDAVASMFGFLQDLMTHESYDAIHTDQLWMAQYCLSIRNIYRQGQRPITVLDQHNAVFLIPDRMAEGSKSWLKRVLFSREARILSHYELDTCRQFDHVVWVSGEDRSAIAGLQNRQWAIENDNVIPICVDPEKTKSVNKVEYPRRVTFLGGMHWPPNSGGISWFAKKVWPLVKGDVPDATLTIIGKNPPVTLNISNGYNVEVTGFVTDLTPYLKETAVFIVPLFAGGGMRVKILDAWSWGLPVVSTAIGAEGITFEDGQNILIADTPEEFADAVISVLHNQELANQLSVNGRRSVESNYDWRKVYKLWDRVYPR